MMDKHSGTIIIRGATRDGRKFRPSDWAQRLTSAVASFYPSRGHQRRRFHPSVRMATIEGINCVVVDAHLEEEDPMLYAFLMNFGEGNNLEIIRNTDQIQSGKEEAAVS